MDIFKNVWGWITDLLAYALNFVVKALPDSPFTLLDNSPIKPYLGFMNWALPVNEVIATLEVWLVAVGIFYLYQVLMRWTKAIE